MIPSRILIYLIKIFLLDFISERKLAQTLPLTILSDSRLGIDAAFYITQLLESQDTREPLLAATGGAPLTLTTRIEADLRALDKLRIKPLFVFPGLSSSRRQRNQHQNEHVEACRARYEAWSKYESGNEEQATRLFDGRSCIQHWDLWRSVLRIFRHRNVEFMVAPYLPWAQVCFPVD
jgi:XPG N-terminal domain